MQLIALIRGFGGRNFPYTLGFPGFSVRKNLNLDYDEIDNESILI
jgi:hypothetical protein